MTVLYRAITRPIFAERWYATFTYVTLRTPHSWMQLTTNLVSVV
jgi:hypothetical protein